MGTTLTGTTVQSTYDSIIKIGNNGPLDGTIRRLSDGLGNDTKIQLSTAATVVDGNFTVANGTVVNGLVETVNGLENDVTLVAGDNITINLDGNNIEISSSGGGSGTPGGSDTYVQYNNAGAFGGEANFTYNQTSNALGLIGTFGHTGNYNNSAGDITLTSGDITLTAGNLDMTLGNITLTDGDIDLSGNVTLNTAGNQIIFPTAGSTTKADGIAYPDVQAWGEALDTHATGETLAAGSAVSTVEGRVYCFRAGGGWVAANVSAQANSAGTLGVSVGGGTVSRFLTKGWISIASGNVNGTSPGIGSVLYLSQTTAGNLSSDAPTTGGYIVRKVGQIMDEYVSGRTRYWKIWFDPDWYYTTV